MTPPGLTCADCERRFRPPQLARPTDEGYVHVVCPGQCAVEGCSSKVRSTYCSKHYKRFLKYGDPLGGFDATVHIEDVEWMAAHGETIEGAAARVGRTVSTLVSALYRAGRQDLTEKLRSHAPPPPA